MNTYQTAADNAAQRVEDMRQVIVRIDDALRRLDQLLDALQPALPGKLRVEWRLVGVRGEGEDRRTLTPQVVKWLRKNNESVWWSVALRKGTASRSRRRSKDFEANSEAVSKVCQEVDRLLDKRARIGTLLQRFSSGVGGLLPATLHWLDEMESMLDKIQRPAANPQSKGEG